MRADTPRPLLELTARSGHPSQEGNYRDQAYLTGFLRESPLERGGCAAAGVCRILHKTRLIGVAVGGIANEIRKLYPVFDL
jgi:hypothetical protein